MSAASFPGVDIVEVSRFKRSAKKWGEAFLKRIFTAEELRYSYAKKYPFEHLAARFAAKEAVFKALGDEAQGDFRGWSHIEIRNEVSGRPVVKFSPEMKKRLSKRNIQAVLVSLSHCRTYAVASACVVHKK